MADETASGFQPPTGFAEAFAELLRWRRDVRRFRPDPLPEEALDVLLDLACLAPSVGNSQPWRFLLVEDSDRRQAVREDFARCNRAALEAQNDTRRALYARLKLEGLDRAPVQLAVFCDEATAQGHGLGRATMPEMLRYSAVLAVHTLWLAARVKGIGVGWLSILDPERIREILVPPPDWHFIAYLCLGYPEEEHLDPELERAGWQARDADCRRVLRR